MAAIHISELLSWEEMKCNVHGVLCQDESGPTTALMEWSSCETECFLEEEEELSQGDDGMVDVGKRTADSGKHYPLLRINVMYLLL